MQTTRETHGIVPPAPVAREDVAQCGACGSRERVAFYAPGDIMQCLGCGVLYVSPRPTAQAIGDFYSALGRYDHWDKEPGRVAMWERRVRRIRRLVPRGRLLDIGAGQGDFGAIARAYYEVDGTEVSSEGQRVARERHGLALRLGDACEIDLPLGRYDVVTLWHVLEHVAEPRRLIARAHEVLSPGGVVCVAVPNTDDRLRLRRSRIQTKIDSALGRLPTAGVRFDRLLLERPEEELHLTHFTLRTLCELLERSGFDLAEAGLDDYSVESGTRARLEFHAYELAYRLSGLAAGGAIFAAGRKR
ncbi:MAG TPA: class I SAM-dependent methyltransferase [Polyangiaceae bacterium]|nr:class I SAM-dependent methyltransferase [Polyangiaceae bacterium]